MTRSYGKMRASFDSDGTSMGASPPQSPRHPVYFVQSPSREPSIQSTPMSLSPNASPLHHSFSKSSLKDGLGSKPGSRRVIPQPDGVSSKGAKKGYNKWTPGGTILEEEEQQPNAKKRQFGKWCMCGISFLVCFLLFIFGAMIFWLVCRPHTPKLSVKDIQFHEFSVVPGTNDGVPTRVFTANCTVILDFRNPSNYFGLHVAATDVALLYSELEIGTGTLKKFYQQKGSKKIVSVNVAAKRVPLYGAGPSMQSITDVGGIVPLTVGGIMQSRAYVFYKLFKPKYRNYFSCDVGLDSSGTNFLKVHNRNCSYTIDHN